MDGPNVKYLVVVVEVEEKTDLVPAVCLPAGLRSENQ